MASVRPGMAVIAINPLGPREFQVEVSEGGRQTEHRVAVPASLGEGVELPAGDLERVVRESFRFLLELEPASAILSRFSLSDITSYFPEYPSELPPGSDERCGSADGVAHRPAPAATGAGRATDQPDPGAEQGPASSALATGPRWWGEGKLIGRGE